MSKGNRDPEFIHVQTAACFADADHGLKPSNVFFLQPLLPLNPWGTSGWCRLPAGVLQKAGWSSGLTPSSASAPLVLPELLLLQLVLAHLPPCPAGIGAPGVLQDWCLWLGTAALWGTAGMQKIFSPFPLFLTLVEKEPWVSAWESTSPPSDLTGCGEHTLIHEVDAYGFISTVFG